MSSHGFQRTPFASRLLRHAMRDRARRETGSPDSSTSPMFDDWQEGVHDWICRQTVELVGNKGIRLHDYVAAMNSSMVFGFNLFMPFREHGASSLEELLAGALGIRVRLESNGGSATVCCFDRQIQAPGDRRKLDLMGFRGGPQPALVAIEVKRYPDPRIQDVPKQIHEYLEIFDRTREGLRTDVAR